MLNYKKCREITMLNYKGKVCIPSDTELLECLTEHLYPGEDINVYVSNNSSLEFELTRNGQIRDSYTVELDCIWSKTKNLKGKVFASIEALKKEVIKILPTCELSESKSIKEDIVPSSIMVSTDTENIAIIYHTNKNGNIVVESIC
nr:MAG TPA: hypothetical protein [Caudoviricetes sp.]